ncbi:MAG TPA: nucleoside diphosphate kinase regulator [Planctomycetaceae bacterium]|nr:nucleoside diphosphate kinase regulator [Planctomycetaceae bacterium]
MMNRNIFVSTLDYSRLHDLVLTAKQFASASTELLDFLDSELTRAKIVSPEEIPPYVVTMNTCVHLVDLESGEDMKVTLVYPSDAKRQKGNLSILSDLGIAIIGFSVGDTIQWSSPEGLRHLKVNSIDFQPEAINRYDL